VVWATQLIPSWPWRLPQYKYLHYRINQWILGRPIWEYPGRISGWLIQNPIMCPLSGWFITCPKFFGRIESHAVRIDILRDNISSTLRGKAHCTNCSSPKSALFNLDLTDILTPWTEPKVILPSMRLRGSLQVQSFFVSHGSCPCTQFPRNKKSPAYTMHLQLGFLGVGKFGRPNHFYRHWKVGDDSRRLKYQRLSWDVSEWTWRFFWALGLLETLEKSQVTSRNKAALYIYIVFVSQVEYMYWHSLAQFSLGDQLALGTGASGDSNLTILV
jgi:hypothetical protein